MRALRVARVLRGIDMRPKHKLRTFWMRRVAAGEVAVLLNGRATQARLVDHEGGVHDYYVTNGHKFDEGALYNMVERGLRIALHEGQDTAAPARHLKSA